VLAAVHRECRWRRAIFLKVEPSLPDDAASRALLAGLGLRESAHRVQPASTVVVDLTAEPAEISARMKPKWRYNAGLAARRGVTVRAGSLDDVPAWYSLMVATGRRDGFAVHSEEYYRQFLWLMGPLARLLLAEHEGRLLGGIVATAFAGEGIYMYGASADEGRSLMPNHLLQWEAMLWARQAGCRTYDLWGIPDEAGRTDGEAPGESDDGTAALTGVFRFKSGFGGRVVRSVGAWDRVYVPALYWLYERVLPPGLAGRTGWVRRRRAAATGSPGAPMAPPGAG
jgi:lipid II:glycine glycyltransferase (peptidoglycan interpeptide bridge formation enzyme)